MEGQVNRQAPDERPIRRTGLGFCPLVLGECVQGRRRNGQHFLITAPLGLFSWAEFNPDPELPRVVAEPGTGVKSALAASRWLAAQSLPGGGRLRVVTPVRHSQGFGTSTADIVASVRAAATAWGRRVGPRALARLAADIEPTDGSMYPGSVAFAHRDGLVLELLGELPRFEVLVLLPEGGIDTVEFDALRRDFRYGEDELAQLETAWRLVREANRTAQVGLLGRATTMSARINERLLPKPGFGPMQRFVESGRAEGLIVAHSGTLFALLFDPRHADHARRLEDGRRFLDDLGLARWVHLTSEERFMPPARLADSLAA